MIPKIIHYCWFGGSSKPEIVKKCISSWHKYCPDWEIIEWNESNYDVNSNKYTREAHESKKWAFVSDVARLEVVDKFGGIYLDTDVELVGDIDDLIQYDAFFAFETNRNLNTGLGFGAIAGHFSVCEMLSSYKSKSFIKNGKPDLSPCPAKNTEGMTTCCSTFRRDGTLQIIDNILFLSGTEYAKYAIHHGAASWAEGVKPSKHIFKDTKLKRWLRKPEHFDIVENRLGKRAVDIYTFAVYDLMEMGPFYYIKRLLIKLFKYHK